MAAVRTSAVKSQAASLLRPEPAESLLLNSAIPDARMFFRRRKLNNDVDSLRCIPRSDQPDISLPSAMLAAEVR